MRNRLMIVLFVISVCMIQCVGTKQILPDDAKVQKLAGGFCFTEGPASDSQGNVFFTDQPNDRILKWSVDGELSIFLEPSQRSNGMIFSTDGKLISCADERNRLVTIDEKGNIELLTDQYQGAKLNGPNDCWQRPDGGIYFTDPFYRRPWWNHTDMPQDGQHVYFLAAGESLPLRVADDLQQPNGLIGTPDGKTLYVADIRAGKTYAWDIQPDGSLFNKRLFAPEGSDGMTMDNRGNVYLTNRAVSVFNPEGEKILNLEIPETPANVCFGGKDHSTLFITARTSLYAVQTNVHGAGVSR